ncbi:MAG: hypothetical protein R3C49_26175 [Planctomycetaceae bacterium]
MSNLFAGVDLGGTSIKAAVADASGDVLLRLMINGKPERFENEGADKSEYSNGTRPRFKVLLLLVALTLSSGHVFAAEPAVRLLFAGSSSTYWNDLPGEVAKLISGRMAKPSGRPVTAEIVGRSGSDIRVYLDPECNYQYGVKPGQSFLDKVRDEKFDYVSLMVVCRFITGDAEDNPDGKAHAAAVTRYCQAIRDAGGEPVTRRPTSSPFPCMATFEQRRETATSRTT